MSIFVKPCEGQRLLLILFLYKLEHLAHEWVAVSPLVATPLSLVHTRLRLFHVLADYQVLLVPALTVCPCSFFIAALLRYSDQSTIAFDSPIVVFEEQLALAFLLR